jgi:hypothetical protein
MAAVVAPAKGASHNASRDFIRRFVPVLVNSQGIGGGGRGRIQASGCGSNQRFFPAGPTGVQGAFDIAMFIGGATGIALGGVMAQSFDWLPRFSWLASRE